MYPAELQVGVDPAIMGVGPAAAIPAALAQAGLTTDDIDVSVECTGCALTVCSSGSGWQRVASQR